MSLSTIAEVRDGRLALKVLRRKHSGDLLFAVDRVQMHRVVFGVLLSAYEVRQLVDFVQPYALLPARRAEPSAEQTLTFQGSHHRAPEYAQISTAINQAKNTTRSTNGSITVLPSLPEFTYLYTCPQCGSHAPSNFSVPSSDGLNLRLCPNCQCVYPVEKRG